jgi:hypothetical protein
MSTTPILTEHVVIDATDRFAGDPGLLRRKIAIDWDNLPENAINAMPRFDKPWSEAKVRRAYGPSIKMLPFVAMKEDAKSWCDNPLNYWCDEPTKKGHVDFRRGVLYAELTLKAIKKDGACPHYLERIFEAIIDDAIERRRKGGKGSRTNRTSTVHGFLHKLSQHICGSITPDLPSDDAA